MKTAEDCFLEIVEYIKRHPNNNIDEGEGIVDNVISYYKLRNFNRNYVYKGSIVLEKTCGNSVNMNYYFSNKRSYISLYTKNKYQNDTTDFNKLQYNLLLYTEKLFIQHKIDAFIYGLNCVNKNNFF